MGNLQFRVTLVLWLGMISLFFLHHVSSQIMEGDSPIDEDDDEIQASGSAERNFEEVVLSNGIVNLTLTVPEGFISGISYKGSENLLNTRNPKNNRGYWDMTWNGPNDKLSGTTYEIVKTKDQTEISFKRNWTSSSGHAPLNVDKRFVLLKDCPGFYTYTVVEHLKGSPAFKMSQTRIVLKPQEKFRYMAVSDNIQRFMPRGGDRRSGQVLGFKEAVHLTNPADMNGEVDDKYFYSLDCKDIKVHGWVGDDDIGLWMITPSNEFLAAGPFKTSLTSHTGPTMLTMFTSTHYAGVPLEVGVESSENWKKVLGPVFVYLNSDPSAKTAPSKLWDDAKKRSGMEEASWPYTFPLSSDFLKSNQRGAVRGQLLVHDWFKNPKATPATSGYVGLAAPGPAGSWQYENKGYQFWVPVDNAGHFIIKNVLPGTYSLYAAVPGVIGDYKHVSDITITPGAVVEAKDVVFEAPRNGPTLWEIGIPDRTAAEFFIPDPSPQYKPHNYSQPIPRYKQYGLWDRYAYLYPNQDIVFTVGKSDYKRDWFFVHLNRRAAAGGARKFSSTSWAIVFKLEKVEKQANYTLQVAIAGANAAELQVRVNRPITKGAQFSTGRVGTENIIPRYGIHGLYRLFTVLISGNDLVDGDNNTISLRQAKASGIFGGIMYDYIRFEGPKPIGKKKMTI